MAGNVSWDDPGVRHITDQMENHIRESISVCIYNRLRDWCGPSNDCWDERGGWVGEHSSSLSSTISDRSIIQVKKAFLRNLEHVTGRSNAQEFQKALMYRRGHGSCPPRYQHHVIRDGDAVEVLLDTTKSSARILEPSDNGKGERQVLYIASLGGWRRHSLWAAVTRFTHKEGSEENMYELEKLTTDRYVFFQPSILNHT